jgi:hypothetical protein
MDTHEGLLPVNCLLLASLLRDLDAAAKERQLSRTGLVRLLAANEVARQRAQREIIAAGCPQVPVVAGQQLVRLPPEPLRPFCLPARQAAWFPDKPA